MRKRTTKRTTDKQEQEPIEELRKRMAQTAEQERAFAESCPDTKTYLSRHENPHFMAYEVVEMEHMTVIFTTENYAEAIDSFNERFKQDRQARLDLVVREVKTGMPLFRQTVMELSEISCEQPGIQYTDDYGRFGPSVYNHIFRDAKWAGYEAYTRPTKVFNFAPHVANTDS